MTDLIALESVVEASKDQVSCDLGDEIVILNVSSGIYYGLSGVGARVWNFIQEPQLTGNILRMLLEEYEVEPSRCEQELALLLKALEEKSLLHVKV